MEVYEVIGIQRKIGTFNNQPYDNYVFSVISPADAEKSEVGNIASLIKVKASSLVKVPAVGDTVSPVYDRFGRVVGFN